MRFWLLTLFAATALVSPLLAQPPTTAASTGQKGQLLPGPFRVYAINGERAQHFHCFFCQHGLNPAVAVIALQAPANPQEPLAVLLQKLNAMAAANKDVKLGAFAIFLTLDKDFYEDGARDPKVAELEGLNKQLNLTDLSLGLSHPEAQPVKQFGIITRDDPLNNNTKRHVVTVLVYDKHKVVERFQFTEEAKLDEAAIQRIFAAVESLTPKK